jgi:hyaluronoglucosaminidase
MKTDKQKTGSCPAARSPVKNELALGALLALAAVSCVPDASAQETAGPSSPVLPVPRHAEYGEDLLDVGTAVVCGDCGSETLRDQLQEIAGEWGLPLVTESAGAPATEVRITFGSGADAAALEAERGEQGYALNVSGQGSASRVDISAGDEAGAFYALQSLRQLFTRKDGRQTLRPAAIKDWPAIRRRGLIFGAQTDTESILRTLDLCARVKLNFFQELEVRNDLAQLEDQIRDCGRFCASHFIEQCAHLGYMNALADMPRDELVKYYEQRYRMGFRSFTINFDDTGLETVQQAEAAATTHLEVVHTVYRHLRGLDPAVRFIFCPIPYGGRPDRKFCFATLDAGKRYLNLIGAGLPKDIPVFWTGDEGVWSSDVTAEGAAKYREVLGQNLFMWDNNTIRFANARSPLTGRAPDLHTGLSGYVANLNRSETDWRPDRNAELTLITIAMYTWNPETYEPGRAAADAARLLATLYPQAGTAK